MRGKRIEYAPRGYLNPNSLFSLFILYAVTKINNGTNNNNTNYYETNAETVFVPKMRAKHKRKNLYAHKKQGRYFDPLLNSERWTMTTTTRPIFFHFMVFSQVDNIIVELSLPLIFKQSAYFPSISLFEMKWNFKLEKIKREQKKKNQPKSFCHWKEIIGQLLKSIFFPS